MVLQTVKDVVTMLVSDDLVTTDKAGASLARHWNIDFRLSLLTTVLPSPQVGTSNFFWSFPGDALNKARI